MADHAHAFTERMPRLMIGEVRDRRFVPWPVSVYVCPCGESGYPVPAALADEVALREVDDYLDSDDDRGYSTEDDGRIPPPEEGEPE